MNKYNIIINTFMALFKRMGTDSIPFIFGVQIHQINMNFKGTFIVRAVLEKGDRKC